MKTSVEIPEKLYNKISTYIFSKDLNIDDYIISLIKNDIKGRYVCHHGFSHTPNEETKRAISETDSEVVKNPSNIWE